MIAPVRFRRPERPGLPASEIVRLLADEVRRNTGAAPQHGDMTMVVMKAL